MIDFARARLIFQRELRDQLRDRRTLFMIFLLPLILYPMLALGMIHFALRFGSETRRIGIVGIEHLPAQPPLLDSDGKHFARNLFGTQNKDFWKYIEVFADADWTKDSVRSGAIDALIILPPATKDILAGGDTLEVEVYHDAGDDDSRSAFASVETLLSRWGQKVFDERIRGVDALLANLDTTLKATAPAATYTPWGEKIAALRAGLSTREELDRGYAFPIAIAKEQADLTAPTRTTGSTWARLLPFMLVMMAMTGAFYPAIDLCAGEKERGTMETLLLTPASRVDVVAGKLATVFLFCVAATVCNVLSMALTFGQIPTFLANVTDDPERLASLKTPGLMAIFWTGVLMLPLAAFFSAICLALAAFARSMKEAQYYLMPMFIIVMPLVFLTLAPGVQLSLFFSMVPVTNMALLLRALMLSQYDIAAAYFAPVVITTLMYAALSIRFAVLQFQSETVMFREAERFEFGLWFRHLLRDKEPLPTAGQAWFCFALMLVTKWYVETSIAGMPGSPIWISSLALVATIGTPAVAMAALLTRDPARTLGMRMPRVGGTLVALILVFAIHPVALTASELLRNLMPISEDHQTALQQFLQGLQLWERLIALALIPAVVEELAFRGFLLNGLLRSYPAWAAIALTSVLFGISHLIPQQMILATLLGVVLGVIATRTGSIWPSMLFHFGHNALLQLWYEWARPSAPVGPATEAAVAATAGWSLPVVITGALTAAVLLGTLATQPNRLPPEK